MSYETVESELFELLKNKGWWTKRRYVDPQGVERTAYPRVIFMDVESAPCKPEDFLTNERILAIGVARREYGEFGSDEGIKINSWLLKKDSDEDEYNLLEKFNNELKPEPLAVIGYGIRDYDLPLLSIKMKRYDPDIRSVKEAHPHFKKLWHIINLLERSIPIDLMTRLRFQLKVKGFDELAKHEKFSHLPLMRIEHPVSSERQSLGKAMYNLWKTEPEKVRALVSAHVHDLLLITESLFLA